MSKLSVLSHKAALIKKKKEERLLFFLCNPCPFFQNSCQTLLLHILKMGSEFCYRLSPLKGVLLHSRLYCEDASYCNSIKTQCCKFPRNHLTAYVTCTKSISWLELLIEGLFLKEACTDGGRDVLWLPGGLHVRDRRSV